MLAACGQSKFSEQISAVCDETLPSGEKRTTMPGYGAADCTCAAKILDDSLSDEQKAVFFPLRLPLLPDPRDREQVNGDALLAAGIDPTNQDAIRSARYALLSALRPIDEKIRAQCVGTASTSQSAQPATPLAKALAAWDSSSQGLCSQLGGTFQPLTDISPLPEEDMPFGGSPTGFIRADFNGDGKDDFLIKTLNRGCSATDPNATGAPVDFVVSDGAGYRSFAASGIQVGSNKLERRGDRDVFKLKGGYGAKCPEPIISVWGWNGQAMAVVERRNEAGEPVGEDGCKVAP